MIQSVCLLDGLLFEDPDNLEKSATLETLGVI